MDAFLLIGVARTYHPFLNSSIAIAKLRDSTILYPTAKLRDSTILYPTAKLRNSIITIQLRDSIITL